MPRGNAHLRDDRGVWLRRKQEFRPSQVVAEIRTSPTTSEALNQLDPDEQAGIQALIEGALLRHQARKLAG